MEAKLPDALVRMVHRHDDDLYRGDPPGTGLTTRMALVEASLEKLARNTNKLIFAAVAMLLTVVAEMIKNHFIR
jgi:hypothetical protein